MSLYSAIKSNILENLNDSGGVFYSSTEVQNSVQDAIDDIAFQTMLNVKKTSLFFTGQSAYKDLSSISDFMACIAIFDVDQNRWLLDNLTWRDFRMFRPDWEMTVGSPQYWAHYDFNKIATFPHYDVGYGARNWTLYYAAKPATVVDGQSPVIPADKECLIEQYCTGDLLESAEEFKKAAHYFQQYYDLDQGVEGLRRRMKNLAKSDLIILA